MFPWAFATIDPKYKTEVLELNKQRPSHLLNIIVKSSYCKIRNIFVLSQALWILRQKKINKLVWDFQWQQNRPLDILSLSSSSPPRKKTFVLVVLLINLNCFGVTCWAQGATHGQEATANADDTINVYIFTLSHELLVHEYMYGYFWVIPWVTGSWFGFEHRELDDFDILFQADSREGRCLNVRYLQNLVTHAKKNLGG